MNQHQENHPHKRIIRFVPAATIPGKRVDIDPVQNITFISREYASGLDQEDPYDRIEIKRLWRAEQPIAA